jgi:GNAT superfamily N-acetyltransferase
MMKMSRLIKCRAAEPGDLDSIARVWHESARFADDALPEMPSVASLRERIDAELATGWSLWVTEVDHAVVGMLALKKSDAVLDELYVLPSVQRSGIGSFLLEQAMREMPRGFTLRTAACYL